MVLGLGSTSEITGMSRMSGAPSQAFPRTEALPRFFLNLTPTTMFLVMRCRGRDKRKGTGDGRQR